MIYLQLFLSFLQVGMFSVGGGYAAMPLIQSQVFALRKLRWNPILTMCLCGVAGLGLHVLFGV